ncbi:MAG: alpha/beta fold hydrolase [Cellulosimicrobium funkei]|uniref:alpha/beta fold hydrolase n=1 Tax=Cellulosimicrobium funkei TaxID=264251 RepID=UPI003F8E49E7
MSTHGTPEQPVHVVLVPGWGGGGGAWPAAAPPRVAAGSPPPPVPRRGVAPGATAADRAHVTRADHVAAVTRLIEELDGRVVLVGHSGGGPVVQEALDRDPARIERVVYVDTGPLVDGAALSPELPADAAEVPLPTWEELAEAGSSVDGLDEAALARFRERAVPTPGTVARGAVRVSDPRRLRVPATAVCSSIPSAVLAEMAHPGPPLHTELGEVEDLTYVDLPTGHWPMLSRPRDLAAVIVDAVS